MAKLLPNLENKEYNIIFVDLRKAFDSLDHEILLYKRDTLGIRGTANLGIKDYLTNRKQVVRMYRNNSNDYVLSDPWVITHGIPQGSLIGPLLF